MSDWKGTEAEAAVLAADQPLAVEKLADEIAAVIRRAQAHAVRRLRLLREVHTGMILAWDGHGWVTPEAFADAIERGEVEP